MGQTAPIRQGIELFVLERERERVRVFRMGQKRGLWVKREKKKMV